MDDQWQKTFDENALRALPEHQMSCWSKEGFEERFRLTPQLVKELDVKTILDVGCGPGAYCRLFHDLGYEVTGVDYAPNVIEKAKERAPDIDFQVANGYKLPFADNSFDLVLSIGALQCIYDHEQFIKELTRVAKKVIIISTLRRGRRVADPQAELEREMRRDMWPTHLYHEDELVPLFEETGFATEVVTRLEGKFLTDSFFIVATR